MPTIIILFGITITMNFLQHEHGFPHIHAMYGENEAVFKIEDSTMLKGFLKPKQRKIVERFIKEYKEELLNMWNKQEIRRIKI